MFWMVFYFNIIDSNFGEIKLKGKFRQLKNSEAKIILFLGNGTNSQMPSESIGQCRSRNSLYPVAYFTELATMECRA